MKRFLAATLAATMCMGLVACGSSGKDAQTTKGEESTTTAEASGESDLSGRKAILIVNGNLGDLGFFDSANRGMQRLKDELGLDIQVIETGDDEAKTYTKVSASQTASTNQKDIDKFGENNDEYKFVRFGLPTQEKQDDETVTTKSVDNYLFGADGHIDITNGVDHVYQIVIWLHDDNFDQNREQAKNFSGTIKINVKSDDNTENITGTRD